MRRMLEHFTTKKAWTRSVLSDAQKEGQEGSQGDWCTQNTSPDVHTHIFLVERVTFRWRTTNGGIPLGVRHVAASMIGGLRTESWSCRTARTTEIKHKFFELVRHRREPAKTRMETVQLEQVSRRIMDWLRKFISEDNNEAVKVWEDLHQETESKRKW